MKNVYKVLGIIALVVMAGCSNGSTDGSNGNGRLLEFRLSGSGDVYVQYENICYSNITYNGSYEDFSGVIQDFTITIDDENKPITKIWGGMAGYLQFSTGETYTYGDPHTVKVVYTANPSRKVIGMGYKSESIVVSSFVAEGELTVKAY